jgi:hypothetical protein
MGEPLNEGGHGYAWLQVLVHNQGWTTAGGLLGLAHLWSLEADILMLCSPDR